MIKIDINSYQTYFFVGIAGSGMSAIAQYLAGIGKNVSGSDRRFKPDSDLKIQQQLEKEDIKCFPQDGSGINQKTDIVIVSTAVEEKNVEYQKALSLNIPLIKRADLLAAITRTSKTIAVSGTSGKSTVTAMIFHCLEYAGLSPSIISGAGLVDLEKQGKIGNAQVGTGDWLVIEADESDGTLVNYSPEIGIILNIDKDHKEMNELLDIFSIFSQQVKEKLIVNTDHTLALKFSKNNEWNFGSQKKCVFFTNNFKQTNNEISFTINNEKFTIKTIGKHNMENAAAAVAACFQTGISIKQCADALKTYQGILRRMQLVTTQNEITIIDDYAHNPAKIYAAISACQNISKRVIAWFQPHGFVPTRFLRAEFVKEISRVLREDDQIWMSEIYYAGGTVSRDISANDLIADISKNNKKAYFCKNRENLPQKIASKLQKGDVVLLMGARDPSLDKFAYYVSEQLYQTAIKLPKKKHRY